MTAIAARAPEFEASTAEPPRALARVDRPRRAGEEKVAHPRVNAVRADDELQELKTDNFVDQSRTSAADEKKQQ